MEAPLDQRVLELVRRAAGMGARERDEFLSRECPEPGVRVKVIEVLTRQATATIAGAAGPEEPAAAPRPRIVRLGQYTVLGVLGEGGMGTVYLAQQERPHRQVALKVVRGGTMSARLLRRFELESAVLARLQHPGIAQIHEAGTAERDGETVPFFAMELVRGTTLTAYASGRPVAEKLALFARVCDAVQHAHAKGVIHRDLKPGNILVDESGQPKVLDFGVARATDADVATATMQTDRAQIVGTVPYMSPEQISGDAAELDTRSDVYSLGVVLYELLTGSLPHRVLQKSIAEAARMISTEDPAPLASSDRSLRGDLETIVGKALERDRGRRYQSASELGEDLRRFMRHEPVSARPPSTAYQLRKFAARHRGLVAGLAAAAGVLVLGIVGTTLAMASARRSQHAAEAARERADLDARTVRGINDFLINKLLMAASPEEAQGKKVTVDEVLGRASTQIEGAFPDNPVVRASLHQTIGRAYLTLGEPAEASKHLTAALELRRRELGNAHADTAASLHDLGSLEFRRSRWPEAEALFREAGEIFQALNPADPRVIELLGQRAAVISNLGRRDEAEQLLRRALAASEQARGTESPETLAIVNNLGFTLQDEGKLDQALPLYRRVVETRTRLLGADHPSTLLAMNNLSTACWEAGDLAKASEIQAQVLEARRRVSGPTHPDTVLAMSNAAFFLEKSGKFDRAIALYTEALDAEQVRVDAGQGDLQSVTTLHDNLASALQALERWDEAEQHLRTALEIVSRASGPDSIDALFVTNNLGAFLVRRGRTEEAAPILERSLASRERLLGRDHPDTLASRHNLAALRQKQGRLDEAEALCREVLADRRRVRGPEHPATLATMALLVDVLEDRAKLAEAAATAGECLRLREKVLGERDPATLQMGARAAALAERAGDVAAARTLRERYTAR